MSRQQGKNGPLMSPTKKRKLDDGRRSPSVDTLKMSESSVSNDDNEPITKVSPGYRLPPCLWGSIADSVGCQGRDFAGRGPRSGIGRLAPAGGS